eukprot:Selendium_serpulae@DN6450_c2_g5_i5.p1
MRHLLVLTVLCLVITPYIATMWLNIPQAPLLRPSAANPNDRWAPFNVGVYYINLQRSPRRRKYMEAQLATLRPNGDFTRISAVDRLNETDMLDLLHETAMS